MHLKEISACPLKSFDKERLKHKIWYKDMV